MLWFFTPAFSIFQPIAGTIKSAKKGKGEEGEQRGGRQLHTEISIQCPIQLFGNLRLFVGRHFYWTERIIFVSRKCFTKDLRSNSCTVAKASESIRRIGAIWRCQEIGSRNPPSMVGEPEQEYKKGRDTFWNKTNTLDPSTQWSLRLLKDPYASFSTLRYVEAVILDLKLPEFFSLSSPAVVEECKGEMIKLELFASFSSLGCAWKYWSIKFCLSKLREKLIELLKLWSQIHSWPKNFSSEQS